METTPLRWKAVAGFLVTHLLISVTSGLKCHSITSYTWTDSPGYSTTYPDKGVITCLPNHNACVDLKLELSTVSHTLFIDHRNCANTKHPNGGKESSKTGDKYFAIKSQANYCSSDLCNAEKVSESAYNETKLVKVKCKPSSSKKCYADISHTSDETRLKAVTCRSNFDQCYQGSGRITIGNSALHLYIKSCQSSCNVPQKQVFGPIEITMEGSCCSGNYCNKKENAHPAPTTPAWKTTSGLYGNGTANHTSNFTSLGDGYGLFRDFECEDYVVDDKEWSVIEPTAQGRVNDKGATLQLRPLLVTLVVTVLGLSW